MSLSMADIESKIPNDHSEQASLATYLERHVSTSGHVAILDLGCGTGRSYDVFKEHVPSFHWIGVDIEDSPEVRRRNRTDCHFVTFDGVNLPFRDESFDLILSQQVFEHVRHPEPLLKEVARVLKPQGSFIGSVSQLEPFHSYSLWNFTYYGFATLAHDAGLELQELRPGIDAMTLILRNLLKFEFRQDVSAFLSFFSNTSPLNQLLAATLGKSRRNHRQLNKLMLRYCGQFWFKFGKAAAHP